MAARPGPPHNGTMDETADYTCPHCGETIQLAVDPTGGDEQTYIEDCPVCCNPNLLHVVFNERAEASVSAEAAD